jgi:hypothetical protein
MRLSVSTNRHGRNRDRHGSNAGVSPQCFTAHPVIGDETCHYTHLTVHYLSSVTLEVGYDKARTPQSRGFGLIHLVSTQPRPNLDAQRSSTEKGGRHGTALRVISPSHPLRHHDVWGWPAIPRARRHSHSYRDRQNVTSGLPGVLASSYPIKGQAGALQRGRRQKITDHTRVQNQVPSTLRLPTQRSTSQAIIFVLFFSLFETWAHRPFSQACNPYTSTSVQGNTKLSPPAARRAFFSPNQDKPPCVLLVSPSRTGTRSTHSSV